MAGRVRVDPATLLSSCHLIEREIVGAHPNDLAVLEEHEHHEDAALGPVLPPRADGRDWRAELRPNVSFGLSDQSRNCSRLRCSGCGCGGGSFGSAQAIVGGFQVDTKTPIALVTGVLEKL